MSVTKGFNKLFGVLLLGITAMMLPAGVALAGGGMVLKDDACIIEIDFYSAHFTAYQPQTRGNEQFCQQLPDLGETLFVLDYLHPSLRAGGGFRWSRACTGKAAANATGRFYLALPRDGRTPGDDSAARPTPPRVPATHREGYLRACR